MNSPLEVSREKLAQPDHLDLKTLDDLLSGVAVHEGMSLMLGEMRANYTYGAARLHREVFLAMQGDTIAFAGSSTNQLGWCEDSFEPAGIVKRASTRHKEYELTRLGDNQAKGLAGWMLQLSLEAGDKVGLRSLHGVSKSALSKETSSPTDRINIFEALLESPDLKASDIAKKIGVGPNTAVNNLKWLAEHNIIEYTSIDSRELAGKQIYEIPEEFDPQTDRKGMAKLVIQTIDKLKQSRGSAFTVKDLMDDIRLSSPETEIDKYSRKKHAMMIVNELVDKGMLNKGEVDGNTKSKTILLPGMRAIVRRSVEISDAMLNSDDDYVREGKEVLAGILKDKEAVRELIQKWHNESPATNKLSRTVREELITDFMKDHPGATSKDVADALKPSGLTESSAKTTLKDMREAGSLVSTLVDSRNRWTLAETTGNNAT